MIRVILGVCLLMATALAATAQQSYRIQPGDVLQVEVLEDNTLNRNVLVLPDGTFSFPLIGVVSARGKTVGAVQTTIAAALGPNFAAPPNVLVSVNSLGNPAAATAGNTIDVFVMGEVNSPGKVTVDTGTSLLQFLAESGGFTRFAATRRIQLRRTRGGNAIFYNFDYKAIESGAATVNTLILRNGDVVIVPERRLFE